MQPRSRLRTGGLVLTCTLPLLSMPAFAEDTLPLSESLFALVPAAEDDGRPPDAWRFNAGGGMVVMPTFPGARGTKVEAVPLLGASYGRYFIGSNPDAGALLSLGAYVVRNTSWRVGLAVTYDFLEPRRESEDDHLRGLGDIKRTTHAELFAVYTYQWVAVRGSVLTDIGGNDRGTTMTLDAIAKYQPRPQWTLTAGPGLSWNSSQYNRAYFGVDAGQSARSGLPAYSPGSGVTNLRFSVGANYRINPRWNIGATVTAAWLRGDASSSPVTQRDNQMTYGLFASYLF